jgi:hypothetical protein
MPTVAGAADLDDALALAAGEDPVQAPLGRRVATVAHAPELPRCSSGNQSQELRSGRWNQNHLKPPESGGFWPPLTMRN